MYCSNQNVWFMIQLIFRIAHVQQCLLTLNILFDKVGRGFGHEKKFFFLDTTCIIFSSKHLSMT